MRSQGMVVAAGLVAMLLAGVVEARAQLFGERTVGRSLSQRSRPSAAATGDANVGSITGSERFLRGNRRRTDFIGTDSRDRPSFVGSQTGTTTGQVQTAQETLQIREGPDANQGQTKTAAPRTRMYDPRLTVNFQFTRPASDTLGLVLVRRLESSPGLNRSSPIEVLVEGETATLRGAVASERDRDLARLLILFEPGISEVRNELIVRTPPSAGTGPGRSPSRRAAPREF